MHQNLIKLNDKKAYKNMFKNLVLKSSVLRNTKNWAKNNSVKN